MIAFPSRAVYNVPTQDHTEDRWFETDKTLRARSEGILSVAAEGGDCWMLVHHSSP
jgi:hypothetical protein